jgi:uncharacterized membrane protein
LRAARDSALTFHNQREQVQVGKSRLEAFSDGVIAILITIMVLDLKVPAGAQLQSLLPLIPVFLNYLLSFVYLGIYWNNHHHLLHTCDRVNGAILWANLHLLFWLSLIAATTAWMSENHREAAPTTLYGADLLMAAIAYFILEQSIIRSQGHDSLLKRALGRDRKGNLSPLLYICGMVAAFWLPAVAQGVYVLVALLWLIPDRRIESALSSGK